MSRVAKRWGFKPGGGLPDLDLSFLFCPFQDFFGIFPICPGMVRGYSRCVVFLFLDLSTAPMRNSPERVRDTISTFPKKTLRAKGALISEPRFSTLCEMRCFPREKGKRPFQSKTLDKGHFPFLAWEKSHLAGGRKSGLTN